MSRLPISLATSNRVICCPEPVGHSTMNSSPKYAWRFSSARISITLIGIHTGPRQLELPPNMPVSDSAGR